jgi:hypothetical protein
LILLFVVVENCLFSRLGFGGGENRVKMPLLRKKKERSSTCALSGREKRAEKNSTVAELCSTRTRTQKNNRNAGNKRVIENVELPNSNKTKVEE